jgi:hypothetical protein
VPERSAKVERKRHDYRPDDAKVRVLFIGESAPAGDTFFYCGDSGLYFATREAFQQGAPALKHEPDFRDAFMRMGCYLEDLSLVPVNGLPPAERRRVCKAGVELLPERICGLSPRVVVVIGITVSHLVGKALECAGLGDIEREVLPFPSTRPRRTDRVSYRQVYRNDLGDLVRRWRRRQILAK